MLAKCLELQWDRGSKSVSVGSTASYGFVFRGISKLRYWFKFIGSDGFAG